MIRGGVSNFRPTEGYDKDWANGGNNCVGSCTNECERTQLMEQIWETVLTNKTENRETTTHKRFRPFVFFR